MDSVGLEDYTLECFSCRRPNAIRQLRMLLPQVNGFR